jgi:hypothetical protein
MSKILKVNLSPESLALAEVRSFIKETQEYGDHARSVMIEQLSSNPKYTGEYQSEILAESKRNVMAAQYIENWLTQGLTLGEIKDRIFKCFVDHSLGRFDLSDRLDVYARLVERLKL